MVSGSVTTSPLSGASRDPQSTAKNTNDSVLPANCNMKNNDYKAFVIILRGRMQQSDYNNNLNLRTHSGAVSDHVASA